MGDGEVLGDEFKGYLFRISGGNDKQGFAMVQGVLSAQRVRLLLKKGSKSYKPRRTGERQRKSVRGCIVGADLAVLPRSVPLSSASSSTSASWMTFVSSLYAVH